MWSYTLNLAAAHFGPTLQAHSNIGRQKADAIEYEMVLMQLIVLDWVHGCRLATMGPAMSNYRNRAASKVLLAVPNYPLYMFL